MKTVMVGGVFNLLHPGHLDFFEKAKKLGDRLIVVVAHDKTALEKKGRLILPAQARKKLVESLKPVDKALVGHHNDIFRVVEEERPDIIALGYNQAFQEDWFREQLGKHGLNCKVVRIKSGLPQYSTTKIVEKIKKESRPRERG